MSELIERDCFFHGRETARSAFRVCFECGHIFRTERQLQREHHRLAWSISFPSWLRSFVTPTDDIWSCPLCTHDW